MAKLFGVVLAIPFAAVAIWLGFMVLGLFLRLLLVGGPVILVGGVVIFLCQMFENRSH